MKNRKLKLDFCTVKKLNTDSIVCNGVFSTKSVIVITDSGGLRVSTKIQCLDPPKSVMKTYCVLILLDLLKGELSPEINP